MRPAGRRRSSARSGWRSGTWPGSAIGRRPIPLPSPRIAKSARSSREQHAIAGSVELSAERVDEGLDRVTVRVRNDTTLSEDFPDDRDEALLRALVSSHVILDVRDGAFVSMIDPPAPGERSPTGAKTSAPGRSWSASRGPPTRCSRRRSSSTTIPRSRPRAPGDLFDATEIDEILTLRILTLTEDEKRAMIGVDDRARSLLERTESLAREQTDGPARHDPGPPAAGSRRSGIGSFLMMNTGNPWDEDESPPIERIEVAGVEFRRGDRVRVWPLGDADIFDMALKGKTATDRLDRAGLRGPDPPGRHGRR